MILRSVVCFFAHPDDETVLAGGITAMLTRCGIPVHIVCCTRGEGGEMGDPPVVQKQELLGKAREAELLCAAQALGASVQILDYVDPLIGPDDVLSAFEHDPDTLALEFLEIARHRQADLILTHGHDGEYGHPAHQAVNYAVMRAFPRMMPDTLIYTVAALVPDIEDRLWNKSEPAHYALDIRPWGAAKLAAMECHVSQHALFKRRKKLEAVRDALRTVESVRRQHPPVRDPEPPEDEFASLLRTVGAWSPRQ
jgi:LmbE family N-acetylglucosaminyl deacetylase